MANKLSWEIANSLAYGGSLGECFYGAGLDEGLDLDDFVQTVKLAAEIFYHANLPVWNEMEAERIEDEREDERED